MGNFVPLPVPTTTTIPPPTTLKPSPPSAIDNLVPRIAEGPSVSFILFFFYTFLVFYSIFSLKLFERIPQNNKKQKRMRKCGR